MPRKKTKGLRQYFSVDTEAAKVMANFKKEFDRRSPDSDGSASEIIIAMEAERPKTRESRAISVITNFKDLIIPILFPLDRIQTKDKNRFEQLTLEIDMFTDILLMGYEDINLLGITNRGLQEIRDDIKAKINGKKNGKLDQYGEDR